MSRHKPHLGHAFHLGKRSVNWLAAGLALTQFPVVHAETDSTVDLGEIVVTATRREESLRSVPIKIDAYTGTQLEQRGIQQIDDLARFVPGLEFVHTGGVSGNSSNNISIRGISSDVGSGTTAVYIDDTPIQIRNIGYFGSNPYPQLFDLDRVEVLKGPQGTLFGASAEGGAVRFLTTAPNYSSFTGKVRAEVATTDNGAPTYELGGALGGPIASGTLGFRVSAWTRRDGGYIDRVDGTTGAVTASDINSKHSDVFRAALGWKPSDYLTVTPSFLYQKTNAGDRDQYWESLSNPGAEQFRTGNLFREPNIDRFYLPSLKVEATTDSVSFVSNTSLFDRKQSIFLDYTNFLQSLFTGDPLVALPGTIPSGAGVTTNQKTFTQELRVQSRNSASLDWTVGAFYAHAKQRQVNLTDSNFTGGTAANGYGYTDDIASLDEQLSGFVSVDYHLSTQLKVTAGARISRTKFSYTDAAGGPVNGGPSQSAGSSSETPVTPKIGVSYTPSAETLLYANAAKGFRPGGAQAPVPASFCASDLATLGLTTSPVDYKSDSVWSYDAGSKSKLLDGRLNVDANAYYISWTNIQQAVRLPSCSFSYISNLGKASSKGVDLSLDGLVTDVVRLGAVVGYNRTTFDDDVLGGGGVLLAQSGDRIGGPELTGSAWAQADFALPYSSKGYVRADYTFRSKGIASNPAVFSYDPALSALPATNTLALRAGTRFGDYDVSVFANNLTNTHDPLFRAHDIPGSTLFYAGTYRPRTIGLTASYAF